MGVLGWPPSEFWNATPYDFWMAFGGYKEANNIKGEDNPEDAEAEREKMRQDFIDFEDELAREGRLKDFMICKPGAANG